MTLRQALASLDAHGAIVRRPGRQGGTFVAQPRIVCDLTGLAGFTEQMRRAHVRAGARMVSATTRAASRAERRALGLDSGEQVHEVVRVRSADREPLAIEQACFPAALFPDLLEQRLERLALPAAGEAVRPRAAHRDRGARAGHLVRRAGRLLRVVQGSPLMLIERTAYTVSGTAVEFAHDVFRADRTRITVRTGLGPEARIEMAADGDVASAG